MPKKTKRILNCIPSRDVQNDWRIENVPGAELLAAAPLPPAVDLRAPWWPIGDQSSTGSCVGWAVADSLLRWHFVMAERLPKNQLLSVRFIWMSAKETDEYTSQPTTFVEMAGTSLKAALDVARLFGAVTDRVLPFASVRLFPGEPKTLYALAAQFKITSYFNLGRDLDNWKSWLANHGPVLTRVDVDRTWDNAKQTGGNLDEYLPATARGGHAVALVGYTTDRFIVRNSWGLGWGHKGFGYASPQYAQAAFTEAYGVVS